MFSKQRSAGLYLLVLAGFWVLAGHHNFAKAESINLAAGRSYSVQIASSENYPDSGNLLTDGTQGVVEDIDCGERLCAPGWVGFDHGEPVITIDLEKLYEIERVSVTYLSFPSKGVNPPSGIKLQNSFDGLHWSAPVALDKADELFESSGPGWRSRYLRLIVTRDQWVFLDEIRIEGGPETVEAQWEPIKRVLVVTSDLPENDERRLRLTNMLDGMGIGFDRIEAEQLDEVEFLDYQLLVFASSSKVPVMITLAQEQHLATAVESGTNVLWIGGGIWGSFKSQILPNTFGVRYLRQDSNENIGVRFAEYNNLDGNLERLPVTHETMWVVEAVTAEVDSWYLGEDGHPLGIPFVTRLEGDAGRGTTVFIALPLLDGWKADETYYTWARAEILTRALRSLMTDGLVARHPVIDGRDATFLLRLEDYTPGGLYMGHSSRLWMTRMNDLLALTEKFQLPLNIGIVPVYNHAYFGETHHWGEQDPSIMMLKKLAQTAFRQGGSLITHGYDHQNGDYIDDYSGDDWETWDEDSQLFLPLVDQQVITNDAYAEIEKQWGIKPVIWETPHYISNDDTFRAAHKTGFKYFTESDTKLFPNWNGYRNSAQGLMLNIPETGAFFQKSAEILKEKTLIKQLHILPRIVRMNGLFLVFYHNNTDNMYHALHNFLITSRNFDLWKPDMESFARFWEQRQDVEINASIDRISKRLHAVVREAFDGFTLAIQLPSGASPLQVTIDGKIEEVKQSQLVDHWLLYPVLKKGTHDVVVTFK